MRLFINIGEKKTMNDINRITLLGNVAFDVESHQKGVVSFKLVTGRNWVDKDTKEKKSKSEYHRVVCFKKLGDIASGIKKGDRVFVDGEIRTNVWTDRNGNECKTTEIMAEHLEILKSNDEKD
jgi:single-strand DNA-binding protein